MRARPPLTFATVLLAVVVTGPSGTPAARAAEGDVLPPPAERRVDFAKDLKPLFESSCVQCHAKGKDKGGFSLETREAFVKGGDTGPAAVAGKSGESMVVRMVAGADPDGVMPKKGTKWTPDQVGLLRAWIDQGMAWDPTITFAKPTPANLAARTVSPPPGAEAHPVDRLISTYFAAHGLALPSVVDDRTFARRAYLDTIGLLPTPNQLDEFLAEQSPTKRADLVRRLLADRRGYADHWLTFWNDLLRNDYKGAGFIDGGRRQISGWLHASLVNNTPYDRFVAELVNPGKASEGFSRGIIWRGSVNASMLPPMQAAQNVAQVFMGVNLKCASCHDSFVSDWTLADAYGLAAVYSDDVMELIHCDKPTGKNATPRFLYPQFGVMDAAAPKPERLKRLAELITSKDNGRLSRTVVNRLWGRLLGRGLVEPLDEMDKPSWDADLLDWLAEDFVASGYDLKHTIEVILTSRAYQFPTVERPEVDAKDAKDPAVAKPGYVFRGPHARRLTAEQFCDAVSALSGEWGRLPATLDVDFTAGDLIGYVKPAAWVWTDEPIEGGQARWKQQVEEKAKQDKAKADAKKADAKAKGGTTKEPRPSGSGLAPEDRTLTVAAPQAEAKKGTGTETRDADAAKDADKDKPKEPVDPADVLARHKVVFRKRFTLEKVPDEAFAAASASQGFSLSVNGKPVGPTISDGQRNGRVALYDLRKALKAGDNIVVLDVSSHTEKKLNDVERKQFPQSRNHVNAVSGVGFYLRATFAGGEGAEKKSMELTTDATWRVRRAPEGKYKDDEYGDCGWASAVPLPPGAQPIDEGPALPPIARKDFANEPIELGRPLRCATTTAAQPGGIRASLLTADPLMTALDRPNREQVMPARTTAATTLQALELTNGGSFDNRLKRAAARLAPEVAKDPVAWVDRVYRQTLCRTPSESESRVAAELLGQPVKPEAVADFLWALTLLPEFQFVN